MATLNVTNLQNVASTATNVSLLADGTTSLVLNATGTARTGGIRYNAGTLEVYNGGAWVAVGGGGGGGVSAVTASAPLVSSGGATPNLTINAATTAAPGSIEIATLAEAATGTDATKAATPETSVPKDASGMTGAAILPSGTTAQRPATPISGMTRVNTDTLPQLEQYAGGSWRPIGVITSNLTLNVATTGNDTTGLGTVAAPWATPHKAMAYLSNYAIAQGVTVTVAVADGTYTFTTPLNLNHPNGSQIFINGGTTSGPRPTTSLTGGNAVGNTGATLAANDTLLNAYYNTKWQFNGCHGLVCDSGGNVTVNTVLIRGNASSPWSGVLAGNGSASTPYASSGGINLGSTVAVHNFTNGVAVSYGGSISAPSVTVTNCSGQGITTFAGGSIYAPNSVSNNHSGAGVWVNTNGEIWADSIVARYNTGNGVGVTTGGSVGAPNATATNNGGNGIVIFYGGSVDATSATASNNGANGIITSFGGYINAQGATASNNGNSGIATSNGGSILASSATVLNNLGSGLQVVLGGTINAQNATATGNGGSADVFCNRSGIIYVLGATYGTISPVVNTIGNLNAATST